MEAGTDSRGAVATAMAGLRDLVLCGQLVPGEQVRQEQVADQLGVGRAPLREALHALAKQGPLVYRRNQGYFVAKRLPIEQAQIRRMLELLENELMQSIEWPDAAAIDELERLQSEMREVAQAENWTPLLRLNRRFHFAIFGLSPYRLMLDQVDQLWTLADPYMVAKLSTVEARLHTLDDHDQLLEAIRGHDLERCMTLLDEHRSGRSQWISYLTAD